LRLNYLGIIGGILAFVSLVLPWWVYSLRSSVLGNSIYDGTTLYLYQARATILGIPTVGSSPFYCSVALVFLVLSGSLGLTGSVIPYGRKIILVVGGILALLSIVVFAIGLQNDISNGAVGGLPNGAFLFSSGSYGVLGALFSYSTYLSFGFWLAFVAAIAMFAAINREPAKTASQSGVRFDCIIIGIAIIVVILIVWLSSLIV
jgi:hypothetical protein